jgi:hypothetical protein
LTSCRWAYIQNAAIKPSQNTIASNLRLLGILGPKAASKAVVLVSVVVSVVVSVAAAFTASWGDFVAGMGEFQILVGRFLQAWEKKIY